MIKNEIIELQRRLNECISNDVDYSIIYDLSVQLDKLIIAYYRSKEGRSLIN